MTYINVMIKRLKFIKSSFEKSINDIIFITDRVIDKTLEFLKWHEIWEKNSTKF